MRTLALLLLLAACALAGPKLSSQDERDIRAAIEEQAKKDNARSSGPPWSERGPIVYRIRDMELLAANVAIAGVDGTRTGSFPEGPLPYVFILTRTEGSWTIVRKIAVRPPGGLQLISE